MEYSSLDVAGLRFGEPVPGQKITSVALQCTDGGPVRLCFGSPAAPLTSPWHPDTLQQDSTKINLSLVCPPQLKEWIETLEQKAQETVKVPAKAVWHSALKQLRSGEWLLRVKLTPPGKPHPVQCWDLQRQTVDMPQDLSGSKVVPIVTIKHVWFTPLGAGLAIDCTHLMICAAPAVTCPFQFDGDSFMSVP